MFPKYITMIVASHVIMKWQYILVVYEYCEQGEKWKEVFFQTQHIINIGMAHDGG